MNEQVAPIGPRLTPWNRFDFGSFAEIFMKIGLLSGGYGYTESNNKKEIADENLAKNNPFTLQGNCPWKVGNYSPRGWYKESNYFPLIYLWKVITFRV